MSSPTPPSKSRSSFFAKKMTTRQKMTRWLLVAGLVAGAASAASIWHSVWAAESETIVSPAARLTPVQTIKAVHTDAYVRTRGYTGVLRESRRSQVSFQLAGEVLRLEVDEGDLVAADQPIARLDARHIRARAAQITAQLAEATARLDELLAGPRKETIAAKRAELRGLRATSASLKLRYDRREQLVQAAAVSKEEYEVLLYDYHTAAAMADVAQRQLDELLAGTRAEQIAAQRARKDQLEAQLEDVQYELEDTVLLAPYASRVSRRFIDEGTVVSAGESVLELLDEQHLEAWIGLPAAATSSIQNGDHHTISVADVEYDAVVQSLAPDVDRQTRTRNVILRLTDSAATVYPGQVVRIEVDESVGESGYWLPTTALSRGVRGLWSVFVVDDSENGQVVVRRDVELLDSVGERSFVRGTLQPGERVVASGVHKLVVGQRVHANHSDDSELAAVVR